MGFKVGQKVVCIHSFSVTEHDIRIGNKHPIKDEIYTIREIYDEDSITLEEIVNPVFRYIDSTGEMAYHMSRFRLLDYDFVEEVIAKIKATLMEQPLKQHEKQESLN